MTQNVRGNVWKWLMFNISLKGYSTQKGVSGGASVFKIRPCYGKKSSVNENRISYLQIDETVSTGLNNHRGGAPNTKQTEIMVTNNLFKNFYSADSILTIFSISGATS